MASKKQNKGKKEKKEKKDKKFKKQDKKELKKLSERIAELDERYQEATSALKRARKKLRHREQIIEELESQLALDDFPADDGDLDLAEIMEMEIDSEVLELQRGAWKRNRYLTERYGLYLEDGVEKSQAREKANKDLMEKYGDAAGYDAETLEEILS